MDQSVLDALQRWPNVPAVYGWLSLSARGEWRLHPLGDAQQGGPGQGISNPQILGFMNRNYACEPDGKWFFQNGPQRVYLRLDAAPYVLHVDPQTHTLKTHNGLYIQQVQEWITNDSGQLYARTDLGAARVDDRDLIALSEILQTQQGLSLLEMLEAETCEPAANGCWLSDPSGQFRCLSTPAPFTNIPQNALPNRLGFLMNPSPATTAPQVS